MEEQFQDKLYQFQAEPPVDAWGRIASFLDTESETTTYAQKLHNYKQRPPEYIWDQIANQLDGQTATPVISIKNRFQKVFKYGGIAAAILAFALLTSLYLNKDAASNNAETSSVSPLNNSTELIQPEQRLSSEEENRQSVDGNSTLKDRYNPNRDQKRWVARKLALLNQKPALAANMRMNKIITGQYPVVEADKLDRYILFPTSGGDPIRLSKKLFSLFACPENEINCRENIATVQQQVASPTMVASTDFAGMLEMLQSVNNQ